MRKDLFCIDDPMNGATMFTLTDDNATLLKTFLVLRQQSSNKCRGIGFTPDGEEIIMGSDHGCIYVFDRESGEVYKLFVSDDLSWVQKIIVSGHSVTFL